MKQKKLMDYVNSFCRDVEYLKARTQYEWLRYVRIEQCNLAESTVRSWLSQLKDVIGRGAPGVYRLKRGVYVNEALIREAFRHYGIDIDAVAEMVEKEVKCNAHAFNLELAGRILRASLPEAEYLLEVLWANPDVIRRLAKLYKRYGGKLLSFDTIVSQLIHCKRDLEELEANLRECEEKLGECRSGLSDCEGRLRECTTLLEKYRKALEAKERATGPVIKRVYELYIKTGLLTKSRKIVTVETFEKLALLLDEVRQIVQDDEVFLQLVEKACKLGLAKCPDLSQPSRGEVAY